MKTFLTIVEEKSLAKTAAKLFVSQSTISYRLNELEEEIGTKLIFREQGKRTITLTSEGEDFIPLAERWMSLEKDTIRWKSKEISKLNLNIGSVDSLNTYIFNSLYKQAIQNNTSLTINVSTHWTFTIFDLLKSYEIDIGFVPESINFRNIIIEPLFKEKMVVVFGDTRSQLPDFIHPHDLDPTKEIFMHLGSNFKKWHDYWFGSKHASSLIVDTAGLLFKILHKSDYWAIVPITVAEDFKKIMDFKISVLTEPSPERICYKAKHKSPKLNTIEAIKTFENYLHDFIEENPLLESID